MSQIDQLLERLTKVKGRNGSWTACCPAHDDKGPSLSIREGQDGRILMHCFAGCEVQNIVAAVGMDLTDLFPPSDRKHDYTQQPAKPSMKPAFYASDLLRIIHFEATVVSIAAYDMSQGKALTEKDRERMKLAYERINEAARYANV